MKYAIGQKVLFGNGRRGDVVFVNNNGTYVVAYMNDSGLFMCDNFSEENLSPAPEEEECGRQIDAVLYDKLEHLGLLDTGVRSGNVGKSDYSKHVIQPWSIWIDWDLNPFDADIVKRVLRTKDGESRIIDYKKIIHICEERIRQIECSSVQKRRF